MISLLSASRSLINNRADWHLSQLSESNQLLNRHQLLQLPIQRGTANVAAKLLHRQNLRQCQLSQMWSNYKSREIEAFANSINEHSQILAGRAQAPLESCLSADQALQHVVQSCPKQLFPLALQQRNRLSQAMAKQSKHTTLGM